jgi:hypothetical protein
MRKLTDRNVIYEEQGGRRINRYQWQMFFPILFAVIALTLISGTEVKPEVLRMRLFLYGAACLSYLFALQRQNRTKTSIYRLTGQGIYVRQSDKAFGVHIEYWIDYGHVLWAGAYIDQPSLRRTREWYAMHNPNRLRREGIGFRRDAKWNGMGIVYEEKGEVMAKHLEVSSVFLQYLERQLRLTRI